MCYSPAREDADKNGVKCSVYDVVFHPDTYKMSSNDAFSKLLHDTAFDGEYLFVFVGHSNISSNIFPVKHIDVFSKRPVC